MSALPRKQTFGSANVPEQLLRITFFLLRSHDAPYDTRPGGNHENDPDDQVKWPIVRRSPNCPPSTETTC